MQFVEREFIPLLFGGDINVYSVARAFYEQYQVKSYCYGKYMSGPDVASKIINYKANPKIDHDDVFLKVIKKFAADHSDKKILAMGCGDSYVALISKHKAELPANVVAPYIDYDLMESLQSKELFYNLCDKHGIDHPATFIYDKAMGQNFTIDFPYPVILKPSVGITYWEHPFPGQSKVYIINSEAELRKTIKDIYAAGYEDKMIIQDTIPGKDDKMRVLTCYSDKNAKVKMMCLGHVLLEEHQPKGRGNHALIITESDEKIMAKVKALLQDLHYVGFSNFDIKFDERDGKFKFFEINTRQGRSNFYVTGSGLNIAKYVTEEYIYGKELQFETPKRTHLWTVLPHGVSRKYVKDPEMKKRLNALIKKGLYVNPIFLKGDNNFVRKLKMIKNHYRHYKNYKTYYGADYNI